MCQVLEISGAQERQGPCLIEGVRYKVGQNRWSKEVSDKLIWSSNIAVKTEGGILIWGPHGGWLSEDIMWEKEATSGRSLGQENRQPVQRPCGLREEQGTAAEKPGQQGLPWGPRVREGGVSVYPVCSGSCWRVWLGVWRQALVCRLAAPCAHLMVTGTNWAGRKAEEICWTTAHPTHSSLVAQMLICLEDLGSVLGWEDPLEKGMAIYSSILAWRIPWTEEPGGLQSTRLQWVRHNCAINTLTEYCS